MAARRKKSSTERPHIAINGTGAGKAIPATGDKNFFLEDHGDQPNQTAINVEKRRVATK